MLPIELSLDEDFFQEETRNGFFITKKRKEIWAVELDLLAQFDRVCRKYNLTYYLDGGTLLGAVRHHGFIPWDDDIDVEMFRNDYDKLLQIAGQEFKEPYFFQSAYSDTGYVRGHAQLRNSHTCGALPKEASHVKFNQGMFLDIFVLDGVPDDPKQRIEQAETLQKYSGKMVRIACPLMYSRLKYLLKLLRRWFYIKTGLLKHMYGQFERCARQYDGSEHVSLLTFYKAAEEDMIFRKESYSDILYVPFESLECPIPSGYKEILTAYYGKDFMIPQKAPSVHGELILDTEKSYLDVLKIY